MHVTTQATRQAIMHFPRAGTAGPHASRDYFAGMLFSV